MAAIISRRLSGHVYGGSLAGLKLRLLHLCHFRFNQRRLMTMFMVRRYSVHFCILYDYRIHEIVFLGDLFLI